MSDKRLSPVEQTDRSRSKAAKYQTKELTGTLREAPLVTNSETVLNVRSMERRAQRDGAGKQIVLPRVQVIQWLDEFWEANKLRWAAQPHPPTPKQIITEFQAVITAKALEQ